MTNDEEPREPEEEPGEPEEGLSQDPFVEKVRSDPSEPPIPVRVLQGLLGNSDREGYKRLYFTRELTSYAEFRQDDVVFSEPIAPEQPPFVGLDATRVGIRRDAAIEYTRVRAARPVDEFDLDVRLGGAPVRGGALPLGTEETQCGQNTCRTCQTVCEATCRTCDTVCEATCQTCRTQCGQATCAPTCQTCRTQCGEATCQTCQTCETRCGQNTCQETCFGQQTCAGGTCFGRTCFGTCGEQTCVGFTCVDRTCVTCGGPECI